MLQILVDNPKEPVLLYTFKVGKYDPYMSKDRDKQISACGECGTLLAHYDIAFEALKQCDELE